MELFVSNFFFLSHQAALRHTCPNFTLPASQNVPGMLVSPFNPNLYVDYGSIIHFTVKVWTLEGRLNTGRNIRQIGQNGLFVLTANSVVQTDTAK